MLHNPFLGCSVEKNSECATNEKRLPGSPPTANNSAYSSPAKRRLLNFVSQVNSPSPSKSSLKQKLLLSIFLNKNSVSA